VLRSASSNERSGSLRLVGLSELIKSLHLTYDGPGARAIRFHLIFLWDYVESSCRFFAYTRAVERVGCRFREDGE
jgi:hypothetical protein